MTNTIELTDEQMAAFNSGEAITIEPPKPKQWEPTVSQRLNALNSDRSTKAAVLEAFRNEGWPGEAGTWNVMRHGVRWEAYEGSPHYLSPGAVRGPKEFAEEAAKRLNDGSLVL